MNTSYFFAPFPVLDLKDIVLREITSNDAQDYLDYMSRDEMEGFLTEQNRPQSLEKAKEEVEYWGSLFPTKRSIYWGIALKESNKLIGTAGFNHIAFTHSKAEISYDLSPDFWGQGMMLKSIKAILNFSDAGLELVRVQATVITDNQKSINVLERCGFTQEGIMKQYEMVEGVHKDYFMYARVN